MIRNRVSSDDRAIYRITTEELVPMARQSFPNLRTDRRDIQVRLNRGTTYVAEDGGGTVQGFVLFLTRNKELWIDMLAVDRKYQGNGLGQILLSRAEETGRRKGCERVNLFVDVVNHKAQSFYSKLGYRPERYLQQINCYHFSKPLVPAFFPSYPAPEYLPR